LLFDLTTRLIIGGGYLFTAWRMWHNRRTDLQAVQPSRIYMTFALASWGLWYITIAVFAPQGADLDVWADMTRILHAALIFGIWLILWSRDKTLGDHHG
jgi:hypothetical protein